MRQPVSPEVAPQRRGTLRSGFVYAWQGIVYVFRTQRNARIHLAVAVFVLAVAALLRVSLLELSILLVCIMAVIVAEMLNTVVEAVVDLVTAQYHPLAKVAKDVAAGAVLSSAIVSAVIGVLVLGPHVGHALFH